MLKWTLLLAFSLGGPTMLLAQSVSVTISGTVLDKMDKAPLSYVNVLLAREQDSLFVTGTITDEEGRFSLSAIQSGKYYLQFSFVGYSTMRQSLFVGSLSNYLSVGTIEMGNEISLQEVEVIGKADEVSDRMDKKTFSLENNLSQSGGSVLQAMQNLPGVTVQDGKVQLRGNEKVMVLVDGKQTALTGMGGQSGLDNIPASAIEKIEIINNPSSKYDANGNAGIINIIYKKNKQEGFNGKAGLSLGVGALWIKHENLPTIRPQYQNTPKINPSLSLNYKRKQVNVFFQGDYLYAPTLNKNEFVDRYYDSGEIIRQQTKRNRNTTVTTGKAGIDWALNDPNALSISTLFSSEKIIDHGDEPFFDAPTMDRIRLWQFLEDELKTTFTASSSFQHKFKQAGHLLNAGLNYTFHREDEKYFFTNILPTYTGYDSFKLLSDEHVGDFTLDYIRPLKYGRIEGGLKLRRRVIPTNMQFYPGLNSPLDTNAAGWATYKETIPAWYGNYALENTQWEMELGLRVEYVNLRYEVNPHHSTYKSNGYSYFQPFPNLRLAYKLNAQNKFSFFFNRRVDRPNEVDIRIFPKYDDAEIIKVGNPGLKPQFTNLYELGYKTTWKKGYLFMSLYHRKVEGTITRISSTAPGSTLIYAVFQNAGNSEATGMELLFSQDIMKWFSTNINLNCYRNTIDKFQVENLYPVPNSFTAEKQETFSGNVKWNNVFHLPKTTDIQLVAIYLAPDIVPQAKIGPRFSLDMGIKRTIQQGKGELFFNATDLLNTMVAQREVQGQGFRYFSTDYYETQVMRIGYTYKF